MIKLLILAMTLSGCGMASLNIVAPDGTKTSAWGYRLGTDQAVKDLTITVNKDGSRSMTLGSSDSNQTSGLKDANALLGTITGAAVQRYSHTCQ